MDVVNNVKAQLDGISKPTGFAQKANAYFPSLLQIAGFGLIGAGYFLKGHQFKLYGLGSLAVGNAWAYMNANAKDKTINAASTTLGTAKIGDTSAAQETGRLLGVEEGKKLRDADVVQAKQDGVTEGKNSRDADVLKAKQDGVTEGKNSRDADVLKAKQDGVTEGKNSRDADVVQAKEEGHQELATALQDLINGLDDKAGEDVIKAFKENALKALVPAKKT
jgi:hypothetical protein